ncbi:MAG: carbohydrate ABC transporter permease [Bacillota bacterium]|jgi:arabinogalactan oligomer/maltooligosaccharide transport system permease protein
MARSNPKPQVAGVLSALLAGAGQIYNGQRKKGITYAAVEAVFLVLLQTALRDPLYGLVTLDPVGRFVDSRHILLAGIIASFVVAIYVWFHIANIVDAASTASSIRSRHALPEDVRRIRTEDWAPMRTAVPYIYIAPSILVAFFVIVIPLAFGIVLAFTNYSLYHCPPAGRFDWVGLTNFKKLLKPGSLWQGQLTMVLGWNIAYALLGTGLAFASGLGLALILQNRHIRFRGAFRAILMLPWAVPATVSIMVFFGLFNTTFGPVNEILRSMGLRAVPWFQHRTWARVSVLLTHVWISTPFNLSVISAALQSIPDEVYEAATVDGASPRQSFARITFPLLMSVVAPILVLSLAGNFNNFGIIYLLTGGGPAVAGSRGAGATDILMTWVYDLGFRQLQWSTASALAVLVFIFVVIFSLINFKLSGVLSQLKTEE